MEEENTVDELIDDVTTSPKCGYPSHRFFKEFIEIYKKHPCLWNAKSRVFKDKQLTERAYLELEEKYQEIDPMAGLDTVKLRIASLRASYRKELKIVAQTIESAKNGGQLYVPKLWYFRLLTFINEDEYPELNELLDSATEGDEILPRERYRRCDDFSLRQMPRSMIREVLAEFKVNECLWQPKNPNYSNHRIKAKGYDRLVAVCRRYVPDADRTLVKNIIANSRNSYRRELRKMLQSSEEARDGMGEMYIPRLWYFSLMTFLNEDEIPDLAALVESFRSEDQTYATEYPRPARKRRRRPVPSTHGDTAEETVMMADSSRLDDSDYHQGEEQDMSEELQSTETPKRHLCDAIAETVALKLKTLSRLQRIMAEKLINEVLFNAELERLDAHSTLLVTDPEDKLAV